MRNSTKFSDLVTLCKAANFVNGSRDAKILVSEDIADILKTCLQNIYEYGITWPAGGNDPDLLVVGNEIALNFGEPRVGLGVLADNFAELITSPKYRVAEPKNFFLIEEKFEKSDDPVPATISSYRKILQFVELLKTAAAFMNAEDGMLVFVDDGKFELPVRYSVKDVAATDMSLLNRVLSFVGDDIHNEQKLTILANAVQVVAGNGDSASRFSVLLAQLEDLISKIGDGYRLFVASFSYDKVRDSLETAKIEYATKIHKAFSDIQNQILGIPIATVVVASQMKMAATIGYEFWINSAVLIGCWVFVVLMGFTLFNQWHTLSALDTEIRRQHDQIKKEYRDVASRFEDVYLFLEKRLVHQKLALGIVFLILIIGFLLAHVVYYKLTDPVQIYLINTLTC